jgi:succinate dehydrogenase / fumarate reductase cytochrome b subunit
MKSNQPTNIGLGSIKNYRFPITAISSILHRLSGVFLFILIPFLIWALDASLSGASSFEEVKQTMTSGFIGVVVWLFLSAISYHLIAGIRHLIMDIGFGENLHVAKATSILVMILGVASLVLWGIWIW